MIRSVQAGIDSEAKRRDVISASHLSRKWEESVLVLIESACAGVPQTRRRRIRKVRHIVV